MPSLAKKSMNFMRDVYALANEHANSTLTTTSAKPSNTYKPNSRLSSQFVQHFNNPPPVNYPAGGYPTLPSPQPQPYHVQPPYHQQQQQQQQPYQSPHQHHHSWSPGTSPSPQLGSPPNPESTTFYGFQSHHQGFQPSPVTSPGVSPPAFQPSPVVSPSAFHPSSTQPPIEQYQYFQPQPPPLPDRKPSQSQAAAATAPPPPPPTFHDQNLASPSPVSPPAAAAPFPTLPPSPMFTPPLPHSPSYQAPNSTHPNEYSFELPGSTPQPPPLPWRQPDPRVTSTALLNQFPAGNQTQQNQSSAELPVFSVSGPDSTVVYHEMPAESFAPNLSLSAADHVVELPDNSVRRPRATSAHSITTLSDIQALDGKAYVSAAVHVENQRPRALSHVS